MADTKSGLPEGTDTIIEGGGTGGSTGGAGRSGTASATSTTSTATNSTGARTGTTGSSDATDALITSGGTDTGSGGSTDNERSGGVRGLISNAGGKLRDEGKNRARGLVSQGLERGSSTLTNISTLVDDTVQQIEDRLGPQYGDYARKTSQTLNRYATTLQNKDPDELVDDARELIRKSPGVALAGAAIVGFGLVRLLKAGLEESQNGNRNRSGDGTSSSR